MRIRDAQAILVYAAGRYDRARTWWPEDAREQGRIAQWLAFAALELQTGINLARLFNLLGAPCDMPAALAQGERTLVLLDERLSGREWLETDRPTIADCACAPFAARAGEAGLDLQPYGAVRAWLDRLRARSGFTGMQGFD